MEAATRQRLAKNADGDWYTTGACMACGAPEAEAPALFASLSDEDLETYLFRQPVTPDDIDAVCRIARSCCVSAVRYGGQNREIIERLGNSGEYCDFVLTPDGLVTAPPWTFQSLAPPAPRRWWQFWKRTPTS
jgi:hypothetical protein